ncbi:MAG TPA: ABC transporter permease [Chloroflexaceae bacterium]|nr:ABC transporter permease [Chloroflexaceae bacterium]
MKFLANPVLSRELRGRIRGNRALITLVVYLTIIAAVTLLVYAAAASTMRGGLDDVEAGRVIGKTIFITVMLVSLIEVCFITPTLTAGAISGEKERQTYDLLITTLLSPLQIALGKLASALAYATLLIVAALPLAALAFLFGGVSGAELLIGVVGLGVTAVCYATIGLFWSTVMRTTLSATVMALGTVILLLLGVPFIWVVGSLLTNAFDGPPGALYVYVMGLLLSAHPFIALGLSATFLAGGEGPLLVTIDVAGGELPLPSPWLVYVFISTLLTGLFLVLAVRLLRPVQYEVGRKSKGDAR